MKFLGITRPAFNYGFTFRTWHFYDYVPPRSLEEIEQEIKDLEEEIRGMLTEILA